MESCLQGQVLFRRALLKLNIMQICEMIGVYDKSGIGQKVKDSHILYMLWTKLFFKGIEIIVPYFVKGLLVNQLSIDNSSIFMVYWSVSLSLVKLIDFTNFPLEGLGIVVFELRHESVEYLADLPLFLLELA